MLPLSKRLNLSKDFKWVVKGQRRETESLKLFSKEGENITARVGISISKQYFKKAHDKNKAKRKVSKAIETLYPTLTNNLNLIIMPKSNVLEIAPERLLEEIRRSL